MIYIKDYSAINAQLSQQQPDSFASLLEYMKGRMITVFTDSGGISGAGFTGMLTDLLRDRIVLLIQQPSPPAMHFSNRRSRPAAGKYACAPATKSVILFEHICAVLYVYA